MKVWKSLGLMFFILVSPSASLMGKDSWVSVSAMVKIGEEGPLVETRYPSSPIGSSKFLKGSPMVCSISQPLKKSEG